MNSAVEQVGDVFASGRGGGCAVCPLSRARPTCQQRDVQLPAPLPPFPSPALEDLGVRQLV